ncbi:MAG: ricin-type beta-trefoil lectin domain protein [Actinomycetota bacterium]|nr:ricin-type beta-trefoil lectin domain protein [Actinomycetota bacterium]
MTQRPSALLRAQAALRARLVGDHPEGGFAIILTILLILIVAGVSVAIAGVVLSQVTPTLLQRKQVRTINAAEAGLQIAVSQLRTAVDSGGRGSLLALPCTNNGATFTASGQASVVADGSTYAGAVNNGPGAPAYSTSVAYYLQDPTGQSLTWLSTQEMQCPLTAIPYYAFVQSHGTGTPVAGVRANSGNRAEHATYKFNTTNTNSSGGRMIEFGTPGRTGATDPGLCMDAGPTPAVGSTMTMATCLALGTPRQTWQYRTDLSILYGGDPTLGLCVQQPGSQGGSVTLQACTSSTGTGSTYPYASGTQQKQEWGFNDNGHFSTALDDGTVTNGSGGECMQPASANDTTVAVAGAAVIMTPCNSGTTGYTAWNPDPQVGAGKAGGNISGTPGAPTNQYVNYFEFGRCLDITGQNVNADHLIDYPCKQSPDSSKLTFNQVWTYTAVSGGYGTMSTSTGGTTYCLQAPASGVVQITTKPCVANQSNQLWHPTGPITGNYAASYNLISQSDGMCMAASGTVFDASAGASEITVETCDASLRQKWNSPPNPPGTGIDNISEDRGGG